MARKRGFPVQGNGANGGGWINLAIACGWDEVTNRDAAKQFVYARLNAKEYVKPLKPRKDMPLKGPQGMGWLKGATVVAGVSVESDDFLQTYEWRRVRMEVLKKYGARCQCCGATPLDGVVMNVDHIKPRRLFPQLALDINNLQVLCNPCNHGKGNWDMTDWRPDEERDEEALAHLRSIK